jgi:hypothetical protein
VSHQPPRLIVMSAGPLRGTTFALRQGNQLIGRGDDADLIVSSPHLSRRHAYVSWDGQAVSIADAGSLNGTTINGAAVQGTRSLRHGDILGLGDLDLRYEGPAMDETGELAVAATGPTFDNRFARDNYGDINQAGRDISIETRNEYRVTEDNPLDEIFQGRGLGRLLVVVGLVIALSGFAGWMYLIFSGGASVGEMNPSNPFDKELLGLPAPMVAFGAFAAGGIIAGIGVSMSKAARERERGQAQRFGRTRGY